MGTNHMIKDWQRRWIVMQHDKLEYYRNPSDSSPAGSISLVSCHATVCTIRAHCLELITPDRSYWFAAETQPEINSWIETIMATSAKLMENFMKTEVQASPSVSVREI